MKRARNRRSVFLVFTILQEGLGGGLVVEAAREGRIGQRQGVGVLVAVHGPARGNPDSGCPDTRAVQEHVHAADAEHRVVEIEAVEHSWLKCSPVLGIVQEVSG